MSERDSIFAAIEYHRHQDAEHERVQLRATTTRGSTGLVCGLITRSGRSPIRCRRQAPEYTPPSNILMTASGISSPTIPISFPCFFARLSFRRHFAEAPMSDRNKPPKGARKTPARKFPDWCRRDVEDAIEKLLAVLDAADPDPDLRG
jgi:hypothetical protein